MWRIPLSDLEYDEKEENAVLQVLRSRWLSMGPRTAEMEKRFAEYLGVAHAIAVTNATAALELAVQELLCPEIPTDKHRGATSPSPYVIVPDLTFVATANAPLMQGAKVITADIATPQLPFLSVESAERVVAAMGYPPTGVLTVHYAGFEHETEALAARCANWGAWLVEDAAHAIGGRTATGKALGTVGDIGCFSFFSNKNLATGEGGLVVTNDDALAEGLRHRRSHGMTSLTWQRHQGKLGGYDVVTPGHNLRITEITAALALCQLDKLDAGNKRRRAIWTRYAAALSHHPRLCVPLGNHSDELARSACHVFPLLAESAALRDAIRQALAEKSVQTSHHYPAIHSFTFWGPYLASQPQVSRAASAAFSECELTLPLWPSMPGDAVDEVIDLVLKAASA